MHVLHDVEAFRNACSEARRAGHRVALVPTMGALHEGHLTLAREARRHAAFVACTVFVNPTQFGPNEDFARYPRDLEGDARKLASVGVDLLLAPPVEVMYPSGEQTRVRVGSLAEPLCGAFRPGHFEGVATIVTKLFALTGPCLAVFGRKDYQQLQVIRRLVRDLLLPVEILGVPTVREPDGLAMSSRNLYLQPDERQQALGLIRGLRAADSLFRQGERRAGVLRAAALAPVEEATPWIDYVSVADPDTLSIWADEVSVGERVLVAIAARVGNTRLIDNAVLGEDTLPLP
ncbi:MAG: pantoate--beta-alanine ligase [Myxococcales bacterium]|nr:pantoate--beta-alanine ligase [Polyangiaceae bacterium]MDW8249821.1 pantoate--beta-alanine ligase [Myxococcales bacterium]